MSAVDEREQALSILDASKNKLALLFKESYLSMGKGALLVYAQDVIGAKFPSTMDYRTKKEILEVFDAQKPQEDLSQLIENYDPTKKGILTLITSYSNATFFVTVELD